MSCAIIDYESGNLHSVQKSFERMRREVGGPEILVTSDPDAVRRAERIVLPGVGAFADCRRGLEAVDGMEEALADRVGAGVPFLGICVGMQLLATVGREFGDTPGLGLVPGEVVQMQPSDPTLKVPHMGWNELVIDRAHTVLEGIDSGDHAYFVHSFHMLPAEPEDRLAHVEYGGDVTAAIAKGNVIGTQFHPEKSQKTGLRLIGNFLNWAP
ncbi:imidazole glycerol phosphate synthase subunit HisH [Roseobacter sp. HKCCA0434]|uniref:imidazole glycerol phosphate synthase subunit HisH n=1 Tax=Roseobacter sp. HKCCA0434 TaxID=3079297 RepID=UPI002905B15E|nr:imidazole glycerol phosphate synthase subunit HisH [Roseobacter sp. HKCCA0434]